MNIRHNLYLNILSYSLFAVVLFSCKTKEEAGVKPFISDNTISDLTNSNLPDNTGEDDYYSSAYLRYEDYIYKANIHTVLLFREGWELSVPILQLGTNDKLILSFDDLDADIKDYKYTLVHCSATWTPSPIKKNEYLSGFTEDFINDYKFSFNTIQKYTHYSLSFPRPEIMQPIVAGNYLLVVYTGDESNVCFTKRLMIVEPKVTINAVIKRATGIEDKNYRQEIDFEINKSGYAIPDVYKDLKVIIMQNGRWDNAVIDIKPLMVKGDLLDYNHEKINSFSGGNEFRHFDIKSLRYYSDRISHISYDTGINHVFLMPDLRRPYKVYETVKDINGRRLIKTEDAQDDGTEGDYAQVHFFLPHPEPFDNGNLYILGALTHWQFKKDAIAKYNFQRKGYSASLFLKQGYYNYHYVFLEDGKSYGDESVIEGMHYETENDYTILVYCREQGTLFDKLIAIKQLNTLADN